MIVLLGALSRLCSHLRLVDIANIDAQPNLSMAVWQWFKSIAPRTRVFIGLGIMAYAGAGLYLSDKAEEKLGLTPSERDREELRKALPKFSTVEKGSR